MSGLPETGYVRLPQVLEVYPVSKTTWWEGVKSGKFPKSVKLSANCTAWKAEDIHALLKRIGSQTQPVEPAGNILR